MCDGRYRARTRAHEYASFTRRGVQGTDPAHKLARIGQVQVRNAALDARAGHAVVAALERPSRVNQQRAVVERFGERVLLVQVDTQESGADLAREGLASHRIASRDTDVETLRRRERTSDPPAEDPRASQNDDALHETLPS